MIRDTYGIIKQTTKKEVCVVAPMLKHRAIKRRRRMKVQNRTSNFGTTAAGGKCLATSSAHFKLMRAKIAAIYCRVAWVGSRSGLPLQGNKPM